MPRINNKKSPSKVEQEHLLWYFECMDRVNRVMQGTNDLEQAMKDVLDTLLSVFECDRAWLVHPCNPDEATWQVSMERTRPEYPSVSIDDLDSFGSMVCQILEGSTNPETFGPDAEHGVPAEITQAFGVQSLIAMTLQPKLGKPWLFGLHQCSYARAWTPEEMRLFQEIGRRLSDTMTSLLAYRNLQESEKQVKQLIDSSPVAMVIAFGVDEQVESINDKFIELFGYAIEDMPDMAHWWSLAYPDEKYREEIKTQWLAKIGQVVMGKGQIEPMEATVTCKDGSRRYVEFRLSSIGQRLLVTFVDLTERKQAEDALQEREIHSQSLLRLSRNLERAQTYANVLEAARDEVKAVIGYQNLWVYLLTEDKKYFKTLPASGSVEEVVMSEGGTATLTVQGDRMLEEIAETKEIVVVEDARTDARTDKEIVARMGNRTIVNVPIILFDKHLGSIGTGTFGDEGVRPPSKSEREYFTALASHVAVSLDRVHLLDRHRQAEQALRESEEKFRALIEQSSEGVALIDEQGEVIEWNQASEDMTGLARSDVFGMPLWAVMMKVMVPEKRTTWQYEHLKFTIQQALKTGNSSMFAQPIEAEFCPGKSEERHYIHQTVFPVKTEKGFRIASLSHDITGRRQTEQKIKQLAAIVESSDDAVIGKTLDGTILSWNKGAEKIYGYAEEDVLGSSISILVPSGREDEVPRILKKIAAGEHIEHFETMRRRKDGRDIFMSLAISPIRDADGKIVAASTIGRDITEQKRAEAEIQALARFPGENPNPVLRVTQDGVLLYANPSSADLLQCWNCSVGKRLPDIWYRLVLEVLDFGSPREVEVVCGERCFALTLAPIKESGYVNLYGRDITEHKQAEELLRKSEEKFRALAENIPNVVFQCKYDSRYTFLYLNDAIETLTGYPKEAFLEQGLSFFDLYHPDDLATMPMPEENNMTEINHNPFHISYRIRHKSGEWRWVDEWGTGITNANGEVEFLEGIMIDITERKRAEDALRTNNMLLERIFATTEFMIAYLDTDFKFIRVNRAYAEAAETLDPGYFEGKNHFTLYPNAENEAIFRQVVETGEPYITYARPFKYVHHPERGTAYWNWSLLPVKDDAGHVSGLVLSLVDVTERERAYIALRQREEQLRLQGTALEAAANSFMITDQAGKIIWVNPAFTRLTGYSREDIVGLNPRILKSGRQNREFYEEFWNMILSGNVWHGELINHRKDGNLYTEEMTVTPLRGEHGEITHFIAVKQDISERKHHEREREAIIKVSTALRRATTRTGILEVIMDQLIELFKADGAVLVLPDPRTGGFIDEMGRGVVGKRMIGLNIPPGKGVCNWVITNKKPYLNNRADCDPLFYRPDLLGDSRCLASVPLVTQDLAIGALWIARRITITEQELGLLNAIADIAANAIHRVMLHEQTEQQLHHLIALHQIDLAISTNFDLDITLNVILSHVKHELDVDATSILLLGPATHTLDYAAGMGFRTRHIKNSHIKLGSEYAGRAAQEYRTVSCPDLRLARETFTRTSLLDDEEFVTHYATPLVIKGQVKGVLELFHRRVFTPSSDWINYFETLATQVAIAIESASLFENLQRSNQELMLAYDATIEGWSRALDLRDKETEGHTQRVTEMALTLADKLGMNDTEKMHLRRGALLHDIGKMGVPDSILLKPDQLSDAEWVIMRRHPSYAYQMLSPITYLKHALEIPYCHHERWDGSGYPRGLKGEEIPLSARLFAIVDVFDALTTNRPYRKAWSCEKTYTYIQEEAGKRFDPRVVKIFLETR